MQEIARVEIALRYWKDVKSGKRPNEENIPDEGLTALIAHLKMRLDHLCDEVSLDELM